MGPTEKETNGTPSVSSLRDALTAALHEDPIDTGRVLELSNQLSRLDQRYVRFSVDAGHVSKLGRELVGRQETAIAELIKNAYDADSTLVTVTFREAEREGGSLEIVDDGNGMNRDELINGFMRLSSTMKVHSPTSPRFQRKRAGRKGIGRFAAQRLGRALVITTQSEESDTALRLRFNWDDFVSDRELGSIGSAIEELPKDRPKGTTLLIERLRERFTDSAIRKAYKHVADLLQPFPLSAEQSLERRAVDPGFNVSFGRMGAVNTRPIADEKSMVLDHALAVIDGLVDAEGKGSWSIRSNRYGIDDLDQPIGQSSDNSQPFPVLRNVRFRAHYFIADSAYVPSHMVASIRAALRSNGGIRVYRNGFRVLPYGEPGDDWLGLDLSYRQRTLLVPHANSNFFGFVELVDPTGAQFEETSSREGLINNEAFDELVDFASRAIKAGVIRVNEARGVKILSGQRDWIRKEESPANKIRSAAQDLSAAASTIETADAAPAPAGSSTLTSADLRELASTLVQAAQEQEEESTALLEELGMLRILASLGLTIGEFTHEIRQYLPALQADTNYFAELHSKSAAESSIAQRLAANFSAFRTYASYFDTAISDRATRRLRAQEIRDVIHSFVRTVEPTLSRSVIRLDPPEFAGYRLYARPMHSAEWASILFNLFTNSRKAIARKGEPGHLHIRAGRHEESIFVEFADNGDGIPLENTDRIFNAFFTTATPAGRAAADFEDLVGTGLGLKIVRDIVLGYGGTIRLVVPPEGFETCFRVEVPEASNEEVSDSDY